MANKRKKSKKTKNKNSFFESVKHYSTSERLHFVIGLLICFFTIYIGIAIVSFFFTGAADQSIVSNIGIADILSEKGSVSNWAGIRGAYFADVVMNRWFGIPSFLLLLFAGSIGIKLMKLCKINIFKRFIIYSSLMIWASLFLAFAFSWVEEAPFYYVGGQQGFVLLEMLLRNTGNIGVILILLAGLVVIAVFFSKKTIPVLQSGLSMKIFRKKAEDGDEHSDYYATSNEEDPDSDNEEYDWSEDDDEEDDLDDLEDDLGLELDLDLGDDLELYKDEE